MEVKILGVSEKEWDYVDDLLLEGGNLLGGAATSSGLIMSRLIDTGSLE